MRPRAVQVYGFAALVALPALAQGPDGEESPPFVTTPAAVVERMLALAQTGPGDLVVDLGSGDGRIVIAAASRFGARGRGIELDERLVRLARENARRAGVAASVTFEHGDVLQADLSRATVVTTYLLKSLMNRLQSKLLAELKPGARIVSHAFPMAGWRPDRTETVRLAEHHPMQGDASEIFLWIVPAQVRGEWRSEGPGAGSAWRFRIAQNFQDIEVEATAGAQPVEVREATLSGTAVAWSVAGRRFRGRVEGGRIVGELEAAQGPTPLILSRR